MKPGLVGTVAQELKEVVAEQTLELRLLKKSMIADGGDEA
jgi:transposase